MRTRRCASITTPKGDLFYDLVADPLATRDHLGKNPAGVNAARAVLEAAHRACDAWRQAHSPAAAQAGTPGAEPGWLINREEIERKLRSLGYGHSARISQIAASLHERIASALLADALGTARQGDAVAPVRSQADRLRHCA
ncbi:MAG TPA: hypothetical protein VGA81_00725 [Methylomirabilota bacterium]